METLRGKLGAHEKDQTSLQDTKTKLKQAQKQLKNLEWENEVDPLQPLNVPRLLSLLRHNAAATSACNSKEQAMTSIVVSRPIVVSHL